MLPSEYVAEAVFGLLSGLTTSSPPLVVTTSRAIVAAAQVQSSKLPAVYQVQTGWHPDSRTLPNVIVRVFEFEWFVYVGAPNAAGGDPPSTLLNNIVDACIAAVPSDDSGANPVPFLVANVPCPIYVDPDVAYMEAVEGVSPVSIARIVIKVKVPPAVPA